MSGYKDSDYYSVIFPDLDGCHTYGDSVEAALDMTKDAIRCI